MKIRLYEQNGEHYFQFNSNDGNEILNSQAYQSEDARDNGVESVKSNSGNADRYENHQSNDGKYYFTLKAGNNQEIGRSPGFDTEAARQNAIDTLHRTGTGQSNDAHALTEETNVDRDKIEGIDGYHAHMDISAAPQAKGKPEKKKRKKRKKSDKPKKEKVYLRTGDYLFNEVKYQTMRSANEKHYFVFRDKDEKTILISTNIRGYETESDVDAAIENVLKHGPFEKNYEGKTTKNNKFYFYLNDENGNHIAKSFFFDTEEEMTEAAGLLIGQIVTEGAETAKPISETKQEVDDYLPCGDYNGKNGFHTFYRDDIKEYYFAYNREDNVTFLRSEGYTTEKARDNGIESVKKNSSISERWTKGTAMDGKYHYYALKAGNHQEIARSCYYDSKAEMLAALGWIDGNTVGDGITSVPVIAKTVVATPTKEQEVDDYLPCEDYKGSAEFHKFYRDDIKEYYFAYNKADGTTFLRSEGYTTEKARDNGIESVKKNSSASERWTKGTAMNGKYHYYALKAGNHQEIARSCYYESENEMLGAFGWITGGVIATGIMAAAAPVITEAVTPIKEEVVTPPPTPPVKEKVVAAPPPPPVEEKSGCFKWWWILLLLLLLALLFWWMKGCDDTAKVVAPVKEEIVIIDADSDGVADEDDACPNIAGTVDLAGCPDADKDGIADKDDACPDEAGIEANKGCPEVNDDVKAVLSDFAIQGVKFQTNKAVILRNSYPIVANIVKVMNDNPTYKLKISGYTDSRGDDAANLDLSDRRAKAVKQYLIDKGIDGGRVEAVGYGEADPIADNNTKEGQAKNRRVIPEIVF